MRIGASFALLLTSLPLIGAPAFTIDQVLSAPFPYSLTASPKGDAIAWVENAAGIRNVRIAKAPDYRVVSITRFDSDDGIEIDELSWSPDSSQVFFTRGEGANGRGEFPNPHSDPAGAHQEIWRASADGIALKVADGHSPTVSPDGNTLIWVNAGQIWSMALNATGAKPEQLVHARGAAADPVWSPDSRRVAFTSHRGDHSFIGIYDLRESLLRFCDPSVDTDRSPVWSTDGNQLAFVRIPAAPGDFEFGAKRTGQPWSIRVVEARTGQGREVWRASSGRGSVFWPVSARSQIFWMEGDRLVFPWERDGWLHLYWVPARGNSPGPELLTPGNFEIEHASPSPDGRSIAFSSNQGDPDRRHLGRVSLDGKSPQYLTSGDGIEWAPVLLNDGRTAMIHSDARTPARVAMLERAGSSRDLGSIPGGFPAAALIEPRPVTFPASDGLSIHGQLFVPSGSAPGVRRAAVVFFHGGSRRQMLLGWHSMQYYSQAYGFNQYLANKGYVVLSVNYRSGTGYGADFREALNYGATGASEFSDILGAVAYLRGRGDVDTARIGVWGGSYGGYLAALALARASDSFAAGVDMHGIHDWNLEVTAGAPARDRDKRQAIERTAFESSPLAAISTWRSPVLLVHGDDDRNVAFSQTVQLVEALRKQGVPFEQLIFPDEIHDFLVHADWLAAYRKADEFLSRYLKP